MMQTGLSSPIKSAPCFLHVGLSLRMEADCSSDVTHLCEEKQTIGSCALLSCTYKLHFIFLRCFLWDCVSSSDWDSPLLGVPVPSAVGVHHPAQVRAQQGPGGVQ